MVLIDKKYLEKMIGRELISCDIEPIYDDSGNLESFNIRVVPKTSLENIEIPITILKTGEILSEPIDAVETVTSILQDELKKASSKYCKYDVCWQGRCNQDVIDGSEYCQEHSEQKCHASGCEEQAEGECHGYSGSMVCGAPMCKNHKHKH